MEVKVLDVKELTAVQVSIIREMLSDLELLTTVDKSDVRSNNEVSFQ